MRVREEVGKISRKEMSTKNVDHSWFHVNKSVISKCAGHIVGRETYLICTWGCYTVNKCGYILFMWHLLLLIYYYYYCNKFSP